MGRQGMGGTVVAGLGQVEAALDAAASRKAARTADRRASRTIDAV